MDAKLHAANMDKPRLFSTEPRITDRRVIRLELFYML